MVGFFLVVNINKNDLNLSIIDEDEKYLIVTDGVIFNSKNIIHDYSGENLA